jgi:hypothetical protein
MVMINNTSVADGIPFDPNIPSATPADIGQNFSWNTITNQWEISDKSAYHRHVAIPDIFTTSLNGTTTFTNNTNSCAIFNGTQTGHSVVLPSALTLEQGTRYEIYNTTNQTIAVKNNSGTTLFTLSQNSVSYGYLIDATTVNGIWAWFQVLISSVASGIINYNIVTSTAFSSTTRFPSFQQITGFTVTPQAGTYACWYNAEVLYTTTPKAHYWSFYKTGTQIADSLRNQDTAHSNQNMTDSTMTILSVNGTDTVDVRVSCDNTGTLTVNQRSMLLIRIGT